MEQYKEKMGEFVDKLFSNPNLGKASIIQKENNILAFIKENQQQLQTIFSQPAFFPDLPWEEAVRALLTVLTDRVLGFFQSRVQTVVDSVIHPDIFAYFRSEGNSHIDKAQFKEFILGTMRTKAVRDQYAAVFDAIQAKYFTRYTMAVMAQRKTIYNELVRRDRLLKMDPALIPNYLSLCALFRPLFFYNINENSGDSGPPITPASVKNNSHQFDKVCGNLRKSLHNEIGPVIDPIFRPGLDSYLSADDHPDVGGAAKLISILVSRAAEYDPHQKVDKGAESPDKSWFNIHRRNAKYYGFDVHFLDELYRISGEEGW